MGTHNNLTLAADSAAPWGGERGSGSDGAASAPFSGAFLHVSGERSGGRLSELLDELLDELHSEPNAKSGSNIQIAHPINETVARAEDSHHSRFGRRCRRGDDLFAEVRGHGWSVQPPLGQGRQGAAQISRCGGFTGQIAAAAGVQQLHLSGSPPASLKVADVAMEQHV